MEIATLFTVARVLGLRSGAICGVLVNRNEKEEVEEEKIEEIEDDFLRWQLKLPG